MHATHPDTIRPGTSLSRFMPAPAPIDDLAAATSMSTVILRQAGEGLGTSRDDFRAAPETCHLTDEQIEHNLGRATRMADASVIRQDAYLPPREAGEVHGFREAPGGWPGEPDGSTEQSGNQGADDDLSEASDAALVDIGVATCAELVTDDAIVGALLQRGLRPSAISRIWPGLMARLAAQVSSIDKPSIARLALRRREIVEA